MLSSKNDQEIGWMLDDYGIKHGPVVGSTRSLYEKKLREVMAKERRMRGTAEQVVYREQRDENASFHQRRPAWDHEVFSSRSVLGAEDRHTDSSPMFSPYYTESHGEYTAVRHERSRERSHERSHVPNSGIVVPLWLQFFFFLIVAGVLVFIFITMDSTQSEPFKRLT